MADPYRVCDGAVYRGAFIELIGYPGNRLGDLFPESEGKHQYGGFEGFGIRRSGIGIYPMGSDPIFR